MKRGEESRPPLLLSNGIGANWELAKPFLEALTDTTAIIFDMPGVGGSPSAGLPYRPRGAARLAARPNDLIWNHWVNNYLLGNAPPAFDILYWNADTTRLPARLHGDFIDLYFTNPLMTGATSVYMKSPPGIRAVLWIVEPVAE